MLKAYFDESGFDGPVFTLCGFLAPQEEWSKTFEPEWSRLLNNPCKHEPDAREELIPEICRPLSFLHAVDMENMGQGRFRRIGQKNRDYLIVDSVTVILDSGIVGVGTGVVIEAFNKLPEAAKDRLGSPYLMCMRYILAEVAKRAEMFIGHSGEKIAYVFDNHPKWSIEAHVLYNSLQTQFEEEYRMGTVAFGKKEDFMPLQAADRLAYETYKHFADRSVDRPQWIRLVKHPLICGKYCDENGLYDLGNVLSQPEEEIDRIIRGWKG